MGRAIRRYIAGPAAAAALIAHAACGAGPTKPSSQSNAVLRIDVLAASGGALTVAPGASLQLKAVATDAAGGQQDVTSTATWQSSDPQKAVATPTGIVKAGQDGAVEISATLAGVTGKASISVKPASPSCAAARLGADSVSVTPFNNVVRTSVVTPFSDCRWIATSDAAWLNPGDQSLSETGTGSMYDPSRSGDGFITFTASANRTVSPRTAHVNVTFTDGTALVYTVAQAAPTCAITISPGEHHLPYAPASGSFEVRVSPSSCSWTAWIDPRISPAWNLHASGGSVGNGTISYSANPTPANLSSIGFWIYAVPSNPLDPPIAFRLYLEGR